MRLLSPRQAAASCSIALAPVLKRRKFVYLPSPLSIISGGVHRIWERRKEGKKGWVPLCYLLSMYSFWLHPVSCSTVGGDGCFIRSAFGQALVQALNPNRSSSLDGHRGCKFNYSLVEMRPNGGGDTPIRGLGSSPRGPPGPPNRLRIQGYQKCGRCPPSPFTTPPTTLTPVKCWSPIRLRSFLTTSSPRASY